MMRFVIVLTGFLLSSAFAFVPSSTTSSISHRGNPTVDSKIRLASSVETEAERLLRKARELRAQAEQDEQKVHEDLVKKKSVKNTQTDDLIESLFFASSSPSTASAVADRLRDKQLSLETLERIVDRLDEREVKAEGGERVKFQMIDGKAQAQKVSNKDEAELERIKDCIDQLIDATAILDKEFVDSKKQSGEKYVSHAEEEHWGGGHCSETLDKRIHEIRRERSDQFQKRMEEFREAQRRKDNQKYEDHDLGSLN